MFNIFKKRDTEEFEEVSEPRSQRKSVRTKKKEPPKPWGKKERILVGGVFAFTVLASSVLAMGARSWKLPNLPRMDVNSIGFLSGEKIILEADGGVARSEALIRSERVVSDFTNTTNKLSGVWGLYIFDIKNDFSYGVNQDETFQAASLIKLPLIVNLYELSEKGELNFADTHTLALSDKVGGAGTLFGVAAGTEVSYGELVELMGKQSDNTAFRIGVNMVGEDNFQRYIDMLGMSGTNYDQNNTTPADVGRLFKKIYDSKIVSEDSKQKILESLTDTAYEAHLPAGVPADIQVAHKYGSELHVVNDAGIVLAREPYIVVIMSKGAVEPEANSAFPALSRAIFEQFEFQSVSL